MKGTPYEKFHPHLVKADQWLKDHNAQDLTMESSDGLQLHALWVGAENP